jgi:transposase
MGRQPRPRVPDTRHHDVASDRGGRRAAIMYALIGTAKLNDIDPQAWLADVLERIAGHPIQRLPDLLPWHWRPPAPAINRAAA